MAAFHHQVPRTHIRRLARAVLAGAWLTSLLAGCTHPGLRTAPQAASPAAPTDAASSPAPDAAASAGLAPAVNPPAAPAHPRSRWVAARFADLPGWGSERAAQFWPVWRAACQTPPPAWAALCAEVRAAPAPADDAAARLWLEQRLHVLRVESLDGEATGLATGYYEPQIAASRQPTASRRVALYGPPADLNTRRPYWTRKDLDTQPAAQAALRGRALAYVSDPLDALALHIQGSGRLRITETDGRERWIRLGFAAHNGQPYGSVGRWLVEQGEVKPGEASWPAIREWARTHPRRVQEMLWQNPRVVFFREEPLDEPLLGPKGAQGVPLVPGRSIAVDPQSLPYGALLWLDTTEPLASQPLQKLVVAQDTGSAITGAVRADYFWGWGDEAEAQAGRMKQPLRLWLLWPR